MLHMSHVILTCDLSWMQKERYYLTRYVWTPELIVTAFMSVTVQMLLPSLIHILENILHLVWLSLLSTAMDGRLGLLPAHTPPQPYRVSDVAKEKLLQVSHIYQYHVHVCSAFICMSAFYFNIEALNTFKISMNTVQHFFIACYLMQLYMYQHRT